MEMSIGIGRRRPASVLFPNWYPAVDCTFHMKVSLYTSALASMAQESVFQPWLQRAAALAPTSPASVAVLVPQRADAYFLKSLALSSGLGLWGVHFLTPSDLRDRLAAHLQLPSRIPLREHLRLLLGTAAE